MVTAFDRHEREHWAGRAADYERSFAGLCGYPIEKLLDAAGVGAGMRVLDVGTGTGNVAAGARRRGALVVGVDAEPSMVEAARRKVPGADVRLGVLPELPFGDGEFDVAVSNFVVNHVGDPRAAVREMRRVVAGGGRVAVSVWPQPRPALQRLWDDVFAAAGGEAKVAMPMVEQDRNFARTGEGVAALLNSAGLEDVECVELRWEHRVDPEDWWAGPAGGLGALGMLMQGQPDDVRARIRAEYERAVARHLDGDGRLAMATAALIGAGRRP
ncbi:class I SAM-dependent methyltransferase [Dactylosporangium sp. CA-139066]|uniref:class I SAM-dependent methyltransferase n=1 Tax=Dactylosporangium sp. CA-139066 TaxID=3239930 RepID=UPI003D8C82C7